MIFLICAVYGSLEKWERISLTSVSSVLSYRGGGGGEGGARRHIYTQHYIASGYVYLAVVSQREASAVCP